MNWTPIAAPRRLLIAGLLLALCSLPAAAQKKLIHLRNETISTEKAQPTARGRAPQAAGQLVSGLALIQLEGTLTPTWRDELRQQGVELLQYVPEDAFVARAVNARFNDLRALPFVRWVGDFRPDHKLHATLRQAALAGGAGGAAVSVLLAADATPADAEDLRGRLREPAPAVRYPFGTILRGQAEPLQLGQLAASDRVLWIEPAPKMKLVDEVSSAIVAGPGTLPHNTTMMELGYTGAGVTVAVADSGLDSGEIDAMHPDIAGRVTALYYYGQPGQLEDASDGHGHGTHVAGIIAGNGATGETDENDFLYGLGVAPAASLVAQRIFDDAGNYAPPPDFETLTRDATEAGAAIGSNSWGDDTQGRYDLSAMEFDALVRDADILRTGDQPYILEFSAGNAGPGTRTVGSPAVAKNVIATGACNSDRRNLPIEDFAIYSDGPDTMADFSSRGPCEDGRIKPDVTAPGTWIASLRSVYANDDNAWWPISDEYFYMGGTSQAGPHASGAAAVFVQYYRATHTNATPSPALVKAALINSATDMDNSQDTGPVPNQDEGWGRINLPALIGSARTYQFVDQSVRLTNGQVFEHRLVVDNPLEPLKITLAYTDVPGFPGAVPALVNDLDLEVIAPSGHLYRGNQFADGESIPDAPVPDTVNNVEAVHFSTPVPGEYIVRVRATRLAADALTSATPGVIDQDFALVISAAVAAPGVGVISFDRPVYTAPDLIRISLVDYDLAGQPAVPILLRSTTETNGESIVLQPAGGTGIFTARVATATGPPLPDGRLQMRQDDLIEAFYQDASPAAARSCTARADLRPPVISGVVATNQFGNLVVSWDTDEAATSLVLYGTNTLSLTAAGPGLDSTHEITLTNLALNQLYRFEVVSEDAAGNWTTNDNGGQYFTFTVSAPPAVLLVDSFSDLLPDLITIPPLTEYTDTLDRLGVGYEVFDATSDMSGNQQLPSLAQLMAHRCVIWRISELSGIDIPSVDLANNLTTYVQSGGSLLIASMEATTQFAGAGVPQFDTNVLQVSAYTVDQPVNSILGAAGDPLGAGLDTPLDYTLYADILAIADTEDGSDWIIPTTNAAPFLYSDSHVVGIRSPKPGRDMPGRVVFLSFPLDAVPLGAGIGNNRAGLLRNILNFLAPSPGESSIALDSDVYRVPGRAVVEVEDADLQAQGYATVTFRSTTQPGGVTITLAPTSRPGLFRGAVGLSPTNSGVPGVLTVSSNDTIQADYLDASSGLTLSATASIDTTSPVISEVAADPGYLVALISWDTSPKPADSLVQYSDSPATLTNNPALTNDFNLPDQFTAYDPNLDTAHGLLLTGLEPNHLYFFRVVSRDKAGNTTVDDNQGQLYTFTTLLPVSPPWSDDLENLSPDWSTFTITDSDTEWTWGAPGGGETAHSGTDCWGSNLGGGAISQTECYLITPGILLSGGNQATLHFWHNYDFTPKGEWGDYDIEIGAVEILTDVQGQPTPVQQYFDLSGGWEEASVDLTPYMGQVVYVLWYYALFSFDYVPRLGWLVDDVSVTVDYVPPGTIQVTNNLFQAVFALSGPLSQTGYGQWTVLTNAPPGQYVVHFGDVPWYVTPPPQTNTLLSSSTLLFTGNYTFVDNNSNGLPDSWELQYFGTLASNRWQSLDFDRDGASDLAEVIAGTNPTNKESVLRLNVHRTPDNSQLRFDWLAAPGRSYRLLGGPDTTQLNPLTGWLNPAPGQVEQTVTNPPGLITRFYTLEVQYPGWNPTNWAQVTDTDQDGASDYDEFLAGTDPTDPASCLRLEPPQLQSNGLWLFRWEAVPGHAYRIMGSTDASHWLPLTDWRRETGGPASRTLSLPGQAQSFFRLEVSP